MCMCQIIVTDCLFSRISWIREREREYKTIKISH
jgi:hypothetical protein